MYKLKDIITSGGGNAKINKFINRYVLSKKEKKDIINEIKNKGSNSSTIYNRYYKFIKPIDDTIGNGLRNILFDTSAFVKIESNMNYNYAIISITSGQVNDVTLLKAFQFTPVLTGYIYGDFRLAEDIKDYIYLQKQINSIDELLPILDYIEEITADKFFNLNEL